jgi:hypothetical protein
MQVGLFAYTSDCAIHLCADCVLRWHRHDNIVRKFKLQLWQMCMATSVRRLKQGAYVMCRFMTCKAFCHSDALR